MRRGHTGLGGWRNENPRHFRPRNGGNQHFRPSRGYGLLDQHRFPPPVSRPHRPSLPYKHRSGTDDRTRYDHHDRGKYRSNYRQNSYQRKQEETHQFQDKQMYPMGRSTRSIDTSYNNSNVYPPELSNYYDNLSNHCHMNSMGDIDDRYVPPREPFKQHTISPWATDISTNKFDERAHRYEYTKSNRHDGGESSKLPLYDYTGHRPPSSDHYGGNPTPVINNSGSFNRSIDDTVDLIRKRLLNRNEPHSESNGSKFNCNPIENQTVQKSKEIIENFHQEQPLKKKVNRQRQSDLSKSSNGASVTKIKSKIVNQLFKMDKEKIHKLMDNPNSSSKFEYAISSLITESQYSFNRHLRSVAEKSLHTSSSIDFIQNDSNTIYEDTFMKQMQCILDPQDTVLLEDIKPIVMAELSKALQLDEYEQQFEIGDDELHQNNLQRYDKPNYSSEYYDNLYNYDDYMPYSDNPDQKLPVSQIDHTHIGNVPDNNKVQCQDYEKDHPVDYDVNDSIYESRPRRRSRNLSQEEVIITDSPRYTRRSLDDRLNDIFSTNTHSNPENPFFSTKSECQQMFVRNAEPLEDEEDPFAELDKQYHVAVDHSFIDNDDSSSLHVEKDYSQRNSPNSNANIAINLNTPEKESIKQEIDYQLQNMANSPLKFPSDNDNQIEFQVKVINEILPSVKNEQQNCNNHLINTVPEEKPTCSKASEEREYKELKDEIEKSEIPHTVINSSNPFMSRKRSIDQSPSHRKEKRKKSNSVCDAPDKQIQNKSITVTINENSKVTKKEHDKQSYPEKHTKRKESQKKLDQKDDGPQKKVNSIDNFNSAISPKESNMITCKPFCKSEAKTTLKTFDLFTEQPKKVNVHQAHRNTALASTSTAKTVSDPKTNTALACTSSTKTVSEPKTNTTLASTSSTKTVSDSKTNTALASSSSAKTFPDPKTTTALASTSSAKTVSDPKTKKSSKNNKTNAPIQVVKNFQSVQVQTTETKSICSRFSQTERKKHVAKATQTDTVDSILVQDDGKITSDPLERMKDIDLEIQVLLQEKFKLYSSIESKESVKVPFHGLGMTVVNLPFEEDFHDDLLENKTDEIVISEDSIVNDFTSIPAEELEQIAFESIEIKQVEDPKPETRNRRLRALDKEKSKSQSPTPAHQKRNYKKSKTPNISLIEQIISDERPIEDIISLDDLEHTPVKTRTKTIKSKRKTKRRTSIADNPSNIPNSTDFILKECSVLVIREDFSKYLPSMEVVKLDDLPINTETIIAPQNSLADDNIVNDVHFDMLDVSEDIVIGDICEIKSVDDKEELGTIEIPITEDIILDNSQSSVEEHRGSSSDVKENECKMFDYSSDENLRRDSVIVTGNADAVLAVECIENNFIAACLDGNVYYFSGDGQLITTLRGSNLAVTCLTIVKEKYGTTVYTGSLDSRIRYYDLDTGLEKGPECNVLSPIQTMDRAWDTVFVGTRTGFVLQFECKNNMLIPISTVQFSEQSILALRAMKEGPRKVLLVAARSEDVTIKDAQTGLLLRTLVGPKMTVYTLLYEDGKIYCGTSSSQVHVFDYSSGTHVGAHEGGKGAVCLRASGGLLFAGCYDGCVYVYREGERRPFAQLRGPSLMLLSLAVVGSKIIAGYKDRSLYIWKIPLSILQEMIL